MHVARRFILPLALALSPWLALAQGVSATYRAQAGDTVVLVRAAPDGRIDLHRADTHESQTVAAIATPAGLAGVLPTGEVVAVGPVMGRPHLLVGATLLPLTPITAAQWQEATAATPHAARPAAPKGGSALGGTALLHAKSSNGYGVMRRFDLCSDGTVFYRFEELQSSQLGHAAGARTDAGTWSLQGNQLTVQFDRQGPRTYTLQPRSASSVALDGTVFAMERSPRCR